MITTAEFKRQLAKPLRAEMQKLGFTGTGFIYKKETSEFLIAVYIEGGRWGGSYCSIGLQIHPKQVDKNSGGKLDLKKLTMGSYELRMNLSETARGERWEYRDTAEGNLEIMQLMLTAVKEKAIPVIQLYCNKPGLLDTFKVADLENFYLNYIHKTGTTIATTVTRFCWVLATVFEFTNPAKARQFATYGLSLCEPGDAFFGVSDFERIASTVN